MELIFLMCAAAIVQTHSLSKTYGAVNCVKGTSEIFGESLKEHRSSILKRTGSLIESPSYYGHLTGLENLRIIQRLRNVPNNNIDEVLRIVRLENHKNKKTEQYSLR